MTSNYSITNLFITKEITVYVNNHDNFKLRLPTIKDISLNTTLNATLNLLTKREDEIKKIFKISEIEDSYDLLVTLIFSLGQFREYSQDIDFILEGINFIIPNFKIDFNKTCLKIGGITITKEIWNYILYILKLSYGEKVEKPRTFSSEAERKKYMARQKNDELIQKIRNQSNSFEEINENGLIKNFLLITYCFPSLTFDYLFNQTMAQIHWLLNYAAGAMSYEVNAKAFAAGNIKELKSFIK